VISAEDIARRLEAKRNGVGWKARCPAHEDKHASLTLSVGNDGRVLLKCHAGCKFGEIATALGVPQSEFFSDDAKRERVTVALLAARKRLSEKHLRDIGLNDTPEGVAIPYRDTAGNVVVTKLRTAVVAKDGSRWPKGQSLIAYGLDRLADARELDSLVLVEGESDCWTLWQHGIPALGVPGASSVKQSLKGVDLSGIKHLYFWREPDKGGEEFERAIKDAFGARAKRLEREGVKDPSALHIESPEGFRAAWDNIVAATLPLRVLLASAAAKIDWARPLPPPRPSGLPPLDDKIGGLRAESTYVLIGPPGKGKSGLALQMARAISRTSPVLYLSSELSRRQVIARSVAQAYASTATADQPRLGWLYFYELPPQHAGELEKIVAKDTPHLRVAELGSEPIGDIWAREADAIGQAPMLVLDYLQDAALRINPDDPRMAVVQMGDQIKGFTRKAQATAIVVSSTSRANYQDNENKAATDFLGAGKESGSLEYDAAGTLFLDTDPCPKGGTSSARLNVAKSRFGGEGSVIGLRFHGAVGMFTPDESAVLNDEQKDVYDAIKAGAITIDEVRTSLKIRKQDACKLIDLLVKRGLISKRPLAVIGGANV
jgi:energy-coupling factor transporter ATP-binding protein EcfA2